MRRRAQLLLALFVCFLAGCSGLTTVHDPPSGQVTISPGSASLRGGDTQQFAAQENGATGTPSFVWQVNGVTGGSASTGTIDANGLFLAPEFPPLSNAVTVTASDAADPTKSGSGSVTLMNPIPKIASVSPNPIPVGSFTLTVNGSHFAKAAGQRGGQPPGSPQSNSPQRARPRRPTSAAWPSL